jgi:hypothetical protein
MTNIAQAESVINYVGYILRSRISKFSLVSTLFLPVTERQSVNHLHCLHVIFMCTNESKYKVGFSDTGSTKNYGVPVYKLYEPFFFSAYIVFFVFGIAVML